MDSQDKQNYQWKASSRIASFKHAINGLKITLKEEINFKIHVIISVLVLTLSFYLGISRLEWLMIIVTIGLILICELINTAIEAMVDLTVHEKWHPLAKKAKDISAAAVFVMAIVAILIGVIIFSPYLLNYIL